MAHWKDWVQPDPTITEDLRQFGWAPGQYIFTCLTCERTAIGDKRCSTCQPCALEAKNSWAPVEPKNYIADLTSVLEFAKYLEDQSKPLQLKAALVIKDLVDQIGKLRQDLENLDHNAANMIASILKAQSVKENDSFEEKYKR